MATFGVLFISTTLRTQVRPAIEFVSHKEGLRPRIAVFVSSYFSLQVHVFLEFGYWDTLKFASAPGSFGGIEERWQWRSLRPLALPSFVVLHVTPDAFPYLVPVQRWSIELPATTVGECRRRHSL